MPGGVFICYRREESAFAARAIHDRVVQRLERENVFLDVDNIDLGVDWFNVLTDRVGACDALVAVIGRNWVSSADRDGLRRLDDPDDFVRIEIEAALQRNVRVIPVLVDGAAMPKAGELPESLKGLARRQGTEVSPARFEADVEKLTIALVSILDERRRRDAAEAEAARRAEEEHHAKEAAEAERAAREEREKREAAEAAEKTEQMRRQAEGETARRVEEKHRAQKAAEAERVAREGREQREAAEAAEKVAVARRPLKAEAAPSEPSRRFLAESKEDDGSGLFSGTRAIAALSAPRSTPVRTHSPIIAVAIAISIAAALAILVATFGWPAWKVSAPAGDKAAGLAVEALAAADKAAADKAVAGKAAAEEALAALAAAKAAADKEAAERAAADKAAADKATADKAAADKAAAGNAAAYKAVADAFAADKEANKAAAEPQEHVFLHTISAAVEKQLARGYYPSEIRLMCPGELVRVDWSSAPRGLHIVFYEGEENGFNVRDAELSGQGFALYSVSRIDGCRGDTRVYALWMKAG